jgi:hypothetical protein
MFCSSRSDVVSQEILGIDIRTAEDGAGWLAFWRSRPI